MKWLVVAFVFGCCLLFEECQCRRYKPDWSDLDTRPLPQWYDEAKVGIFLHWGVYSVPSFHSEWFWDNWKGNGSDVTQFMRDNYPPNFTYQDFAAQFHAEFFDPTQFAELFKKAGAKYVVLTSKHHEGFTLFPSERAFSWNSLDVGPRKDLVGELSKAVRENEMKFGVYYSLYEWHNPIYLSDKRNNFTTRQYPDTKMWPEIQQLIKEYKPSVFWADGDWEAYPEYWKSTELLAWMYNDSPVKDEIVVNDRWGKGTPCKHGDFYNCEDRYNPGVILPHKWENAFTVDRKSWGFRRNMNIEDILTIDELLYQVVSAVSCGGNALINVGPTKEGTIAPIFQERLLALGSWLQINGEAIYGTSPWLHQNDTLNGKVWYTCTKASRTESASEIIAIYAIILQWPTANVLKVNDVSSVLQSGTYRVELLGNNQTLNFTASTQATSSSKVDGTLVHGLKTWLHAHEEAQVMLASVLVVVGLWWMVRTVLTLLINLICPLLVVLMAVILVPQLRAPLLGQNYPALMNVLRNILINLADNIKPPQ